MMNYTPKIQSGIDVIDHAWGGLYRGGIYLLYGQHNSGRTLLGLQFVRAGAIQGEPCLYISPERPKNLLIQAASVNFDLRGAADHDVVRIMRISPKMKSPDVALSDVFMSLVQTIKQDQPQRLVLEDLSVLARTHSVAEFQDAFDMLMENMDMMDTTTLISMGEPANDQAQKALDFMAHQATGTIHVGMDEKPGSVYRKVILAPNIGHIEGTSVDYWDLGGVAHGNLHLPQAEKEQAELPPPLPEVPFPEPAPSYPTMNLHEQMPVPAPPHPSDAVNPNDFVAPEPIPLGPRSRATASFPQAPAAPPSNDREAFRQRLQAYMDQRQPGQNTFALVAIRTLADEPEHSAALDFGLISNLTAELLRDNDDLFTDVARQRMVVLLPGNEPDIAQNFLANFKNKLLQAVPEDAQDALRSVSVTAMPDGKPFNNSADLLQYALDDA